MGRALATNSALKSLDVSATFLYAEGITYLSQGLALNKTLTSLNLSANEVCVCMCVCACR
jgi:hypothetical protein